MKNLFENLESEIDSITYNEDMASLPTSREEWLKQRLGKLTSSRFDDMMKEGKRKDEKYGAAALTYVYEKIAELLINAPHIVTSASMEWGSETESTAIARYEEIKNLSVIPAGFVEFGDCAGGTPDGLVGDDGIIEVKCPFNPANHIRTIITNKMPDEHIFQVQGNLMVTNRNWCDFISYDPRVQEKDLQIFIQRIERDEEVIEAIRERLKDVSTLVRDLLGQIKK